MANLAAAIEHIGSTAVPGLAAKPIIDIDILLRAKADFPEAVTRLSKLGYVHQGDLGIPQREAFLALAPDIPHHLYVCPPHSQPFQRHLAFRDYLRAHPETVKEYEQLKRALALCYGGDRDAYVRAKTDFIENVVRQAMPRAGD